MREPPSSVPPKPPSRPTAPTSREIEDAALPLGIDAVTDTTPEEDADDSEAGLPPPTGPRLSADGWGLMVVGLSFLAMLLLVIVIAVFFGNE